MTFTWTAMIGLLFSYTPAQAAASSAAHGYPLKPIRFVVGPSPDLLARIVGQKLTGAGASRSSSMPAPVRPVRSRSTSLRKLRRTATRDS
jgi:hypothetical protein